MGAMFGLGIAAGTSTLSNTYDKQWLAGHVRCMCGMLGCDHSIAQCGPECPQAKVRQQVLNGLVAAGMGRGAILKSVMLEEGAGAVIMTDLPWVGGREISGGVALALGIGFAARKRIGRLGRRLKRRRAGDAGMPLPEHATA